MNIVKSIPLFLYLLIIYNIIEFSSPDIQAGNMVKKVIFEFKLISGSVVALDISTFLIIIGLHALYFEILKSLRASVTTIINHTLSLIVFIVFLIEFIVVKQAGTPCFLIMTFMSLLVVISGFTVSISSARRDIMVDR
ncbi:Uncharacterized protein dnl_33700 [Desulfonema limicola]|uniref:Transmembrane protein n=1 Tax=Desulfonema limicola TaxID=45656 RepID=A0A975B8U6_9BACT|nr:hypothetical protein [Desulfonema limicola]QTA81046.1 Uncharacterized protein dnl_33700 [Desulfonema limicola]